MTKAKKKPGPPRVSPEADARQRREAARRSAPREPPDPEAVAKLGELIGEIRTAMLTVADEDGALRSVPMHTQQTPFEGSLYFLTGKGARKVVDLEPDQQVNLAYADPGASRYVSVTGRVQLLDDRAKIDELWSPLYLASWPEGKNDPDLAVLKVEVDRAEYWETPGSKVVQVLGFAKALLTGQPYEGGEHEQVKLH
jgi:general stress protein 26